LKLSRDTPCKENVQPSRNYADSPHYTGNSIMWKEIRMITVLLNTLMYGAGKIWKPTGSPQDASERITFSFATSK
jgi:TATA-binding protein-associated factor Taf7